MEPYKPQTDTRYGILVVGWTDKPISIQISYENQSYTRKLSPGLFTVGYPQAVSNRPILDIYADSNPIIISVLLFMMNLEMSSTFLTIKKLWMNNKKMSKIKFCSFFLWIYFSQLID